MTAPQCLATAKKTGAQCKRVAASDGYCTLHSKAFATATVAELPELTGPADFTDVGTVDERPASMREADAPAKPPGFSTRHPVQRCHERRCGMRLGHPGNHEGGGRTVATCSARKCRLPDGHPGEHGQPAKERVRVGDLR